MHRIPANTAAAKTTLVTEWNRADLQGGVPLDDNGEPMRACDALAWLLDQCTGDAEREGILSGSFVVAEPPTIFVVYCSDTGDFWSLYGEEGNFAHLTREAADEARDDLANSACWGEHGDQTATEAGIHYYVEEVDVDQLNGLDWAAAKALAPKLTSDGETVTDESGRTWRYNGDDIYTGDELCIVAAIAPHLGKWSDGLRAC